MANIIRRLTKLDMNEAIKANFRIRNYESSDWINWRRSSLSLRQYYFGQQYDSETLKTLQEKKQYTITVNRIRKAISGIAGLLTANMPQFKCVPVGSEDHAMAELASKILDVTWNNNKGLEVWRKTVLQGLRDNLGWIHVKPDGKGGIKYVNVPLEHVIVDPKSRDPLFADAEYIYYYKWISTEQASRIYNIPIEELIQDNTEQWTEQLDANGKVLSPHPMLSDDKKYVGVYEGYKKVVSYETVKDEQGNVIGFGKRLKDKIVVETSIGYSYLVTEELPEDIEDYPWIPIYAEHAENPYTYGESHFLKEYQDIINKSVGIMTYNAQLTSNPKVFVYEDSIPDEDQEGFNEKFSAPGSVIKLSGDGKDVAPPIIVGGQPLSSAWYGMIELFFRIFEEASISNQVLGLRDSNASAPKHSLLEQREMVFDSFKILIGHIETALQQLGKVTLQYTKAYTDMNCILRIVDKGKIKETLKLKQQVDFDNPQQVEMYKKQKLDSGVSIFEIDKEIAAAKDSIAKGEAVVKLINDPKSLDVDIHVIPNSYAPSYQMAKFDMKTKLYTMGVVDNESVLEDAPIDNKEQTTERVSLNNRLMSANKQLEYELEEARRTIAQQQQTIMNGQMDQALFKHEAKMDKQYTQTRAKDSANVKIARSQLRSNLNAITAQAKIAELEGQVSKLKSMITEDIKEDIEETYNIDEILQTQQGE